MAIAGNPIHLPYGDSTISGALRRGRCLGTLDVADLPACEPLDDIVREALEKPLGQARGVLHGMRAGDRVAIVCSDAFRKTGVHRILPTLLDALWQRGIREQDLTFLFATGSHRAPRADEQAAILGEAIYRRFSHQAFVHDPFDDANLVLLGTTPAGTPVRINRRAIETDHLILTGAVALHYFGGFGGGRKSIVPGLAAIDTIAHNHARNLHPREDRLNPDVRIGAMDGNPVAEDMMNAARMVPVRAIINTLINGHGRIAKVFVGDLELAHAAAARAAYDAFAVPIDTRVDFVIAASHATKNFVQSHKALFNAYQTIRPGGRVILAAPCPEGLGGENFTKWLRLGTPAAIIAGLRRRAEINGQTALSTLQKTPSLTMITELDHDDIQSLGCTKAASLDDALDHVVEGFAAQGITNPTYYIMPNAAFTVPMMNGS